MGHRTTRKPGRMKKDSGHPSVTFMIFVVLGFILFIWLVITLTSQPMKPPLG